MAFLTPDSTYTAKVGNSSITVKVKITPDGARATKDICSYVKKGDLVKPNAKLNNGTGKPKGITVHNTDNITVASGTTPAEQYARATYPNGNMNGVAVHYWVHKADIWQQLADSERGWHAADGSSRRSSQRAGETIGGNLDTISIECIETGSDSVSEDTTAKLVAYLLNKHGLDPETDVYTHNYFYSKKYCPAYILPHWNSFMEKVKEYYNAMRTATEPPKKDDGTAKVLHRVQTGAFSKKDNATALASKLKAAGFDTYIVQSDNLYKVQVGAYSKKENADAMAAKLKAAGYDTFITTKSGTAVSANTTPKKTVDELAREVISGKWGNGTDRKNRLTEAGYDYSAVQKRVNELLK